MAQSQRQVRYWNRLAGRWPSPATERKYLAPARAWVAARSTGQVLDVAIGSGANLNHYPTGVELTGVDQAPKMIQAAAALAARAGRPINLLEANAQALPFADHHFDSVICTFSFCCFKDDHAALSEMTRVLRPGGRLLLADHVPPSSTVLRAAFRLAELITVPLQGEHLTRRPLAAVGAMGLEVVESQRTHRGLIECVHAQKTAAG